MTNTWTMRRRSARTRGRSGSRSMWTGFGGPPLRKVFLAWSTRMAGSGSADTGRAPVSMRAMSRRSVMRALIWSACCSMIRKKSSISAGSRVSAEPVRVAAEPLMEASGARSSWLTMARNSARSRSSSSSGVMSCRVTITDSTSPRSERMEDREDYAARHLRQRTRRRRRSGRANRKCHFCRSTRRVRPNFPA